MSDEPIQSGTLCRIQHKMSEYYIPLYENVASMNDRSDYVSVIRLNWKDPIVVVKSEFNKKRESYSSSNYVYYVLTPKGPGWMNARHLAPVKPEDTVVG